MICEERRHDKDIAPAVLDAVYPADAAAFCRHRFHIDKFKLPELMRWWHARSRAPPGRDAAREALDDEAARRIANHLLYDERVAAAPAAPWRAETAGAAPTPGTRDLFHARYGWSATTAQSWYAAAGVFPGDVPRLAREAAARPAPIERAHSFTINFRAIF